MLEQQNKIWQWAMLITTLLYVIPLLAWLMNGIFWGWVLWIVVTAIAAPVFVKAQIVQTEYIRELQLHARAR